MTQPVSTDNQPMGIEDMKRKNCRLRLSNNTIELWDTSRLVEHFAEAVANPDDAAILQSYENNLHHWMSIQYRAAEKLA